MAFNIAWDDLRKYLKINRFHFFFIFIGGFIGFHIAFQLLISHDWIFLKPAEKAIVLQLKMLPFLLVILVVRQTKIDSEEIVDKSFQLFDIQIVIFIEVFWFSVSFSEQTGVELALVFVVLQDTDY